MRQPTIYEFDNFRLNTVDRELRRGGALVPLTPRVFATLLHFVQHPGRLLEKDKLMRAIWPDAVVEENNLNQNVSILRRVLGESRGENRYIVTMPGRGYRFAAEVRSTMGFADIPTNPPCKAIAVLPFVNMSADPENEYFCDGLAEELINALTRIDGLKVVARTSAFSFKAKNVPVSEIRRVLGVDTIVEGSVRRSGSDLRIIVQLINTETGYHLWSERYDRQMEDLFEVQDAITLAVVSALRLKLLGTESGLVLRRTGDSEAYQFYLKGRYYWYKAPWEEFRKSRDYYERAIHRDPRYVLAYSGMADYYGFASATGLIPPDDGWPKAVAAAVKALEIDESLAEVHNPLAAINLLYYRDWTAAQRELNRAVELNPQFAEIHHLASLHLAIVGRFDESIKACRRALELDPLSLRFHLSLGERFYLMRQYEAAVTQYREALELDANSALAYESLGDTYALQGKPDQAIAEWRMAMTLNGDEELAQILGRTHAEKGFSEAIQAVARKKIERLNERALRREYIPSIYLARAYLKIDDQEETFRYLAKACQERNRYSLLIALDPFYDNLRADSRFHNLVRSLDLPQH